MANWNALFADELHVQRVPESEICRFIALLEKTFSDRPLRIWDIGCGAGRHTVAMALLGHDVYASDNAPRGLELTRHWLAERDVSAQVVQSEMTHNPWPSVTFHGVLGWDALHHNRIANIYASLRMIWDALLPGGMLLATLKSDKADLFGQGNEIEPKTFVLTTGSETGVPHHYFDEAELRALLKGWTILALCEQVITNVERPDKFWEYTPFPHTTWGVLVQKPLAVHDGNASI